MAKVDLYQSALALALAVTSCLLPPARAELVDFTPFPSLPAQGHERRPIQLPKKDVRLEDMIPRADYTFPFLQPIPLAGVKIPGLTAKSVQMLGQSYFLVVDNTKYTTMAEVYRENRLNNKSNFVTADSIVHPYLAFTNRVLADTISEHLAPDMSAMLKAMLAVSLSDYKQAEDAEVREDIERNIGFLAGAAKLLDPNFFPPVPLKVLKWIEADLKSIDTGSGAESAIFDRPEDFSVYKPIGWYDSTPDLRNFYRLREWVSHMSYPFVDVTFGTQGGKGNNFRRSVLLYRSLDLATVNGKPAFETWTRISKAWSLLGAPVKDWQESTISPAEYKVQIKTATGDLKLTLNALAEPFFRTRLLLSIRKQKPLKLGAKSVFDLGDAGRGDDTQVGFRLLPIAGDPEWPWLKACVSLSRQQNKAPASWPLALLVLHAWGAPQANNTLLDNYFKLDPNIVKVLPALDASVMVKLPGGVLKPIEDRRWQILSSLFKPVPEGAQPVLRSEAWMTRMLESAFAGWVDSHLTLYPVSLNNSRPAIEKAAEEDLGFSEPGAPARPRRAAVIHYVQPSPETFHKIRTDAQQMIDKLTTLGYFAERLRERFSDFIRLSERLEKMAELELKGQMLPLADVKLLQNIDLILEKVEIPTEGTLSVEPVSDPQSRDKAGMTGVTFGLGRPGQLFIILQKDGNSTLARGAVYTYFEVPGASIKPDNWRGKLDNDLLRPPYWADKFDVVQDATSGRATLPKK